MQRWSALGAIPFFGLNSPGLLIPVGTNMKEYVDKTLHWRFRLPDPPNRLLYYFFRAASLPGITSLGGTLIWRGISITYRMLKNRRHTFQGTAAGRIRI